MTPGRLPAAAAGAVSTGLSRPRARATARPETRGPNFEMQAIGLTMARTASPQESGNLPADVAAIIGRDREVSEAKQLLSRTRLLTLTGVAGVGKTRLALQVGREVKRSFPDGVWSVALSSLHDGSLLAGIVVTALGLRDRSARRSQETLAQFLRDKQALLILDNCEHLVQATATLTASLLDQAPGLRILATSRQRLGLEDEVIMVVPPLDVPAEAERAKDGNAPLHDAVKLFAERARMADSAFRIDEHNQDTIAKLCRRLEGIPLALELAAGWVRVLGTEEIYDRLSDRYRFLTRSLRAAEPTHRTLLAAVDWSFDLCDLREQFLWTRVSVFPAPFDTDAALAVARSGQLTDQEVVDALAGLTDKSILTCHPCDGRSRYSMLETIREYGAAKLAASGEEAYVRRLHRDHYQQVSDAAAEGWFGSEQVAWIQRIGQEWPHIRAALEFCLASDGELEQGLLMASELFEYWISYGAHAELRHWLDRALRKGEASDARTALALAVNAKAALLQGDTATSQHLMDACMDRARASGDQRLRGFVESLAGLSDFLQGDLQQAVTGSATPSAGTPNSTRTRSTLENATTSSLPPCGCRWRRPSTRNRTRPISPAPAATWPRPKEPEPSWPGACTPQDWTGCSRRATPRPRTRSSSTACACSRVQTTAGSPPGTSRPWHGLAPQSSAPCAGRLP